MNDIDIWQKALRNIDLKSTIEPMVRGKIYSEAKQIDTYNKIQRLLDCDELEGSHQFLYNLDIEDITPAEEAKVDRLYHLGVDRGVMDPLDDIYCQDDSCDQQASDCQCSNDVCCKQDLEPRFAFTVIYSAIRNGKVKTGEAYCNSHDPQEARKCITDKLTAAGYKCITILAIEAGDPSLCDSNNDVVEADDRAEMSHTLDLAGVNASTANSCAQNSTSITARDGNGPLAGVSGTVIEQNQLNEDEAKAEVKKAFDEVNNEIKNDTTSEDVKAALEENKDKIEAVRAKLEKDGGKDAVENFDKIINFLNDYSTGKIKESEKFDVNEAKKPSSGLKTIARGCLKLILTLAKLSFNTVGLSGKLILWASNLLANGADKLNGMINDSDNQLNEDGEEDADSEESDKSSDDEASDDSEENSDNDDSEKDSDEESKADDADDDKKEEKAEEPDEKLKDDTDTEEPENEPEADDREEKDDSANDKDEKEDKELDAAEKSQLKDSYKKAFKAAMLKCKFEDKCFDDLDLEQKVEFFKSLSSAWGNKADPSKFMTDKETEQLEKIVVKK